MPTLSSILVQRGAVTMRAVEDAIARQVFHGGDLATNLLEIGAVREELLVPILAESAALPPAPLGRLAAPPGPVLRRVPGELALRHGIFPLEQEDGRLVVAVAEPLAASVEDDLGFALDLAIRQVIAPLVRVRQAIAAHYGIPLERRYLRLVARLDGGPDPSPSAMPPPGRGLIPVKMPRPISIPSPSFGTGVPAGEPDSARLLDALPAAKTPFVAAHDFINPAIPRSPGLPRDTVDPIDPPASPHAPRAALEASPAPVEPAERPAPSSSRRGNPDHERTRTRALAGVMKSALRAERASAPLDKMKRQERPAWRAAHRRKGPFTPAMAERELEDATVSDAVLETLFAFTAQFFSYTAIFVVQGDLAEGRDALGPGADRATVTDIGVRLDQPSSLARARDRRAPLVDRLAREGLDADLARDLGRAPRAVALLPVLVRARVVAILYGDDGQVDVELSALGDVLALIGLAGAALERIALRKKLSGRMPEIPHKVRIVDAHTDPREAAEAKAQGVAALARAVSATASGEEAAEAPGLVEAAAEEAAPEGIVAEEAAPEEIAARRAASTEMGPEEIARSFAGVAAFVAPATVRQPSIARFVRPLDPHPAAAADEASFAVAPPDDSVFPPSQGPRTARYFGEPRLEAPPALHSIKQTSPGIGITFPERVTPPPPDVLLDADPPSSPSSPPPSPVPSAAPADEAVSAPRRPDQNPMRRRLAPVYEGRNAVKDPAPGGFERLPSRPPPNATAWTSFPSTPPPEAVGRRPGARSDPPIPREDSDEPSLPGRGERPPRGDQATMPSVVVDVGGEYKELLARVIEGGQGSQEAFADLVRNGEHVIAAVMTRFPGPLRVDRQRARVDLPAASQCGPILELVVAIRRAALPFVSVRLSSSDPDVRFWAVHVLGELRYPEAASALLPRLFDDDPGVRRIARRSAAALVAAGAAGGPVIKGLDDISRNPEEPLPNRVLAVETMGELRSGALVPSLLTAVQHHVEAIVAAAHHALLLITRQDLGVDGGRWREWWMRNGKRHRVEWLIDALMHDQPALRRAAGDELKALTKEYFGYYDDLPKRERERAQQLYRTWWEREGRARFAS